MSVSLTESAKTRALDLRNQAQQDSPGLLALRIAVKPGGCSGYRYELFFDTERHDSDIVNVYGELEVRVDPESSQLLTGATLEYRDELVGGGFVLDNPNASRSCGCGQSFC